MAERLHVLTPCAKPWNIPKVAPCILQCEGHRFELRWHLLQQGPEPDGKGLKKLNEALGWFKDGWFWTPNDDSIQYPNVIRRVGEITEANPEIKVVVVSEDRGPKEGNRIMRAAPANMKPCEVDGTMLFINREFLGDDRFPVDEFPLTADGVLAKRLYERAPEKFFFLNEVLVRFNSLEQD